VEQSVAMSVLEGSLQQLWCRKFFDRRSSTWEADLTEQSTLISSGDGAINTQIRDYLDLVRRRKMWIILLTLGISLTITVVALRLPSIYRAETVILVNPQKVSEGIVQQTVTGSVGDRLSTIRQEVMSPTQLGVLVKELGLYPKLRGKVSEQELISMMQKSTQIDVADAGGQRLSTFRIAFTDEDRNQVAPVANRLASLFIERNLKAREMRINGTSQFLETELAESKRQLEEKEHILQDVKNRYIMDLPESKQYHLEAMNTLRDQLRNSQDQVNRDRQSKVYLQSMAGMTAQTIDLDQQGIAAKSPYQTQIQKMEMQLKDLQTRYGPNYPDVRKLRTEIDRVKAKAEIEKPPADAPAQQVTMPVRGTHNPVVEAEVNKLDQEIEDQTKVQAELEKQIQYHVGKVQQVPIFEQQIAGLMRDYDTIRTHYNQLQAKRLDALMAGQLETQQAGERFEILDPAILPDGPAGPRRGFMILGGLFFGVMCGIGAAFLVEISDESVRHEREAAHIFGKPVLAGIPKITSDRERALSLWRNVGLTAGTACAAVGVGMVISRFVA
jgi:polysaccharide biosynthesis transport protein